MYIYLKVGCHLSFSQEKANFSETANVLRDSAIKTITQVKTKHTEDFPKLIILEFSILLYFTPFL